MQNKKNKACNKKNKANLIITIFHQKTNFIFAKKNSLKSFKSGPSISNFGWVSIIRIVFSTLCIEWEHRNICVGLALDSFR